MASEVISLGADLVEIVRVDALLAQHGQRFLDRVFTRKEQEYCSASPKKQSERYAARFAAKEAALKAVGTGWRDGIAWTDVEVVASPSGEPHLCVTGTAARFAAERGIRRWLVTLTHTDTHALASVVACS